MKLCAIKEMIKHTLARLLSSHLPVDLILRPDYSKITPCPGSVWFRRNS